MNNVMLPIPWDIILGTPAEKIYMFEFPFQIRSLHAVCPAGGLITVALGKILARHDIFEIDKVGLPWTYQQAEQISVGAILNLCYSGIIPPNYQGGQSYRIEYRLTGQRQGLSNFGQ